jgi:1-aminocyclopropane-1-carboxylate deaminase/D-cysteine desulfhydrase-like pyridoxal-dependent ACC family enzyme
MTSMNELLRVALVHGPTPLVKRPRLDELLGVDLPVYSGKAMHVLKRAVERGDIAPGARVLFVHTGGLPGLLAQGESFGPELA